MTVDLPSRPVAGESVQPPAAEPPRLRRDWRRQLRPGPVVAALILVSLSLMLIDVRGGPTGSLRSAGQWIFGPLETWVDGTFGSLRVADLRRPDARRLQEQVAGLTAQRDELQRQRDVLAEQLAQAGARKQAEAAVSDMAGRTLTARVVAAQPTPIGRAVTISAGSSDGVEVDSAVLSGANLIGRVTQVGPATATVRLITDPSSAVAVRINPSRETALAVGSGDHSRLGLTLLDPLAEVKAGDHVVTMGSPDDAPFPAGVGVATVAQVDGVVGDLRRTVVLQPDVALGSVEAVTVVLPNSDRALAEPAP